MDTSTEQAVAPRKPREKKESTVSVVAAGIANVVIAVSKAVVGTITGSSAMISEAIHSFVDTGNEVLILYGLKRSRKAPDAEHPYGYGSELFFWCLVVAILIFALGGGLSIWHGVETIVANDMAALAQSPIPNYVVIAIAAVAEGTSLGIALKQLNANRGERSIMEYIHYCKDPSEYTVVLEDSAAEAGLLFAFLGVFLSHHLQMPWIDGLASVLIGALLVVVAIVLLSETKGLLIGEGLTVKETARLRGIVDRTPGVTACGKILTVYLGPKSLEIAIDVDFADGLDEQDVMRTTDTIESRIRASFPEADRITIESQSAEDVAKGRREDERLAREASED